MSRSCRSRSRTARSRDRRRRSRAPRARPRRPRRPARAQAHAARRSTDRVPSSRASRIGTRPSPAPRRRRRRAPAPGPGRSPASGAARRPASRRRAYLYCRGVLGGEPLSLEPEEFRRLGYAAIDRLVEHYAALDPKPPVPAPDPDWSSARVPPCPDGPTDPQEALGFLFEEVLARAQYTSHPRFFARISSPSNPLSVLADLAGAGVNVFAGGWIGGAGASAVELAVLEWLRGWMGLPEGSEGVLVSGGSVGTLTALGAAAHARAHERSRATAYVSEHTHSAVGRAWRILGFAPAHLRVLAADEHQRLPVEAAREAIAAARAAGLEPFVIIATAGTTSTGAIDPLSELADLAQAEQLWFHVDGAYGAPSRLVDPEPLHGIERADSLVLDPHKWLFQPYACGCVLMREPGMLERAFSLDGAYLRDTTSTDVQFRDRSPQLTRGSRALKLWLSLRVFGLDAFKAAGAPRRRPPG